MLPRGSAGPVSDRHPCRRRGHRQSGAPEAQRQRAQHRHRSHPGRGVAPRRGGCHTLGADHARRHDGCRRHDGILCQRQQHGKQPVLARRGAHIRLHPPARPDDGSTDFRHQGRHADQGRIRRDGQQLHLGAPPHRLPQARQGLQGERCHKQLPRQRRRRGELQRQDIVRGFGAHLAPDTRVPGIQGACIVACRRNLGLQRPDWRPLRQVPLGYQLPEQPRAVRARYSRPLFALALGRLAPGHGMAQRHRPAALRLRGGARTVHHKRLVQPVRQLPGGGQGLPRRRYTAKSGTTFL